MNSTLSSSSLRVGKSVVTSTSFPLKFSSDVIASRQAMCQPEEAETRDTDDILTPCKALCAMSGYFTSAQTHILFTDDISGENSPGL